MQPPLHIYFLFLSFLTGITLYFRQGIALYLKLFPLFLFASIFVEFLALWLTRKTGSNAVLYNFSTTFEFCFYLFVLEEIISSKLMKRIVLNLVWIYPVLACGNIFFIQGLHNWSSITYSLGSLLIIALCIYYFLE